MKTDTEIVDWLERQHTLHRSVEMTYVVDGYTVQILYDGDFHAGTWNGVTLREAISNAMLQWDVTHGNVNLLKDTPK